MDIKLNQHLQELKQQIQFLELISHDQCNKQMIIDTAKNYARITNEIKVELEQILGSINR